MGDNLLLLLVGGPPLDWGRLIWLASFAWLLSGSRLAAGWLREPTC